MAGRVTEADEQIAVVQYCQIKGVPVYSIPNEAQRSYAMANRLKSMGMQPGIPDLCIPVARGGYHSLYIEMKAKGGRVSAMQEGWIGRLRAEGMCAYVCYGADAAIDLIKRYMGGNLDNR